MLRRSTPVFSNYSINTNHRQMSLTGTDHYNSKLSKVIQFEKKQSQNISILENHQKKLYFW